eukprot:scaffold156656_cov43-Prasinocladus_malaysianus.AAC.1
MQTTQEPEGNGFPDDSEMVDASPDMSQEDDQGLLSPPTNEPAASSPEPFQQDAAVDPSVTAPVAIENSIMSSDPTNPQLKKACLTARQQQAEQKAKDPVNAVAAKPKETTEREPLPSESTSSCLPTPIQDATMQAVKSGAPISHNLANMLGPLLSPRGGPAAHHGHVSPIYVHVYALSQIECLKQFIASDGLGLLNQWLVETRDKGNAKAEAQADAEESHVEFLMLVLAAKNIWELSQKIMGVLKILPVDIDSVIKAQVGKTVRSFKGPHVPADLKGSVKELVQQWKQMLISKPEPQSKRARDGADSSSTTLKKVKREPSGPESSVSLMEANDDSLFKPESQPMRRIKPAAPRRKVLKLSEPPGSESEAAASGSDSDKPAEALEVKAESPAVESGPKPAEFTTRIGASTSDANGAQKSPSTTAIGRGTPVSNTSLAPVTVRISTVNINPV